MAHIHLEDGTFTLTWVFIWWIIALVPIALALYRARKGDKLDNQKIILSAFLATAVFAIFQLSLPIFGGVHISLTPLIGILSGPVLGVLVIIPINIFSAGIGHCTGRSGNYRSYSKGGWIFWERSNI